MLVPPDLQENDTMPVMLYHFGGAILNFITAVIFFFLYLLSKEFPVFPCFCLLMAILGVYEGLINGIPMQLDLVDNDGYNALSLRKDAVARRSFWIQLKVNELQSKGICLKDMPAEWFSVPSDEELKNSMTAVMGVFACDRLMDEQNFPQAMALTEKLLSMDSAIVGLHKSMMQCNLIYCKLLLQEDIEGAKAMMDAPLRKFMKKMKHFPLVLRTGYAYLLFVGTDRYEARQVKVLFEKVMKNYPYSADMESERALMLLAEEKRNQ